MKISGIEGVQSTQILQEASLQSARAHSTFQMGEAKLKCLLPFSSHCQKGMGHLHAQIMLQKALNRGGEAFTLVVMRHQRTSKGISHFRAIFSWVCIYNNS